jgi:hypothetical protein
MMGYSKNNSRITDLSITEEKGMSMSLTFICNVYSPPPSHVRVSMGVGAA